MRFLMILVLLLAVPARAEKADRDKPTQVEANRMSADDVRRLNIFEGDVIVTKGTIRLTCEKLVVRQDAEGFQYATGGSQGVAGLFRRAGAGFALVPADPALAVGAVLTDTAEKAFRAASPVADVRTHPSWIESADVRHLAGSDLSAAAMADAAWADRPPGFIRPATFALSAALDGLEDLLSARGLRRARLGFDLDATSVFEEITEGNEIIKLGPREMNARAYVAAFNFKGSDQQKKVGVLSGGERNRVHLAKVLKSGGNVLMLDEPTNDLDVETLRALEEALLAFPGCAVVISHDRWFLDRIATHILAFEGNSEVVWFEGNFQDYMEDLKRRKGEEATQPHRIKYKPLTR